MRRRHLRPLLNGSRTPFLTTERILAVVLVVAAFAVLAPFIPWLVLALWVGHLLRPLHRRVRKWVGGSERGAAVLVVALTIAIVGPLAAVFIVLFRDAVALSAHVAASEGGKQALRSLVSGDGPGDGGVVSSTAQVIELVKQHGDRAWTIGWGVLSAATSMFIGLFVFLYACFVVLVDGRRAFAWFERNAPVRPKTFERFATAFNQTGRGLFVGVGVTGLIQAAVATTTYLVLGVPRALVLGLLTFFASLLPSVGTAFVWLPVAAGLALNGQRGAAIALVVVGVAVVGSIDNLVRPIIAHWADEHLPAFALMVAMFGGIIVLGGWGILIGPLLLRFGMEALALWRGSIEQGAREQDGAQAAESRIRDEEPPASIL